MSKNTRPYLNDGRLSDVLALIQVLALSAKTRRSENGLSQELQGNPISATSWMEIGLQHKEFFRVKPEGNKPPNISLIARNVQDTIEREEDEIHPPLSVENTSKLMQLANDLHNKELQRANSWKTTLIPILISVIAAISSISAAVISAKLKTL